MGKRLLTQGAFLEGWIFFKEFILGQKLLLLIYHITNGIFSNPKKILIILPSYQMLDVQRSNRSKQHACPRGYPFTSTLGLLCLKISLRF